jgi:hypothetical protein
MQHLLMTRITKKDLYGPVVRRPSKREVARKGSILASNNAKCMPSDNFIMTVCFRTGVARFETLLWIAGRGLLLTSSSISIYMSEE